MCSKTGLVLVLLLLLGCRIEPDKGRSVKGNDGSISTQHDAQADADDLWGDDAAFDVDARVLDAYWTDAKNGERDAEASIDAQVEDASVADATHDANGCLANAVPATPEFCTNDELTAYSACIKNCSDAACETLCYQTIFKEVCQDCLGAAPLLCRARQPECTWSEVSCCMQEHGCTDYDLVCEDACLQEVLDLNACTTTQCSDAVFDCFPS